MSELLAAPRFEVVFDDLRGRVFALARHLTGSRAEAEDVVQETFLAVHQALGGFRGECALSTWVLRIAIHAAYRVRARRRQHVALDAGVEVPDGAPRPDELAAAREDARRLTAALEGLSAEQRTVLSLFAVEGLAHDEIAEILGIPIGTVWSRLHGARKKLALALGEGQT